MITIVNYGSGNINAIANIYKRLSIPFNIAENSSDIKNAKKLIMPGVGSFDYNLKKLNHSGLRAHLDDAVLNKKIPILGICLGLQIMAESSEEGIEPGLGWFKGKVKKFDKNNIFVKPKIPHMGWNSIEVKSSQELFNGIDAQIGFYFIHSYYIDVYEPMDIMTLTHYGVPFVSGIRKNNIYATQFHPEKSHSNGINFLKNFSKI